MKRIALIISIISSIFFSSCTKGNSAPLKNISMENKETIVKVKTMVNNDLQLYVPVSGALEGKTDIVVYSEVSGKIVNINTALGKYVKKGEELASIDSKDYEITVMQANADLMAVNEAFEAAKIKLEVSAKLLEDDKVSKYGYSSDLSAYKKAESQVEGAKATLEKAKRNYDNARFVAPASGYITQLNIKSGQLISQGQAVCSIVDDETLILKTGVGESDILNIQKGNNVEIIHNLSGRKLNGKVTGIGIKTNTSGVYPVEIEIDNSKRLLLPSMLVDAKIEAASIKDIMFTDIDNILEEFGKYYAFIVNEDNIASKRLVETGKKIGQTIIIKSGIEQNENIVISGIDNLANGTKVKIVSVE
ncbi:MAG: efflux RND transporter periplasmic adaptor subunit [Candidatus Delongbacteria bacterium]|nr:efflux RND transporter periplasmic adaptor subunit [Candidatus Delongbacteria bacterium]MBN2836482.1 efflux RND transporter periplasmic adaptor subunit [Candidatus Delongbacteria bacterium]